MKFGSLFAGIGGLDLGLERAGMECVWQVEIDDYATRVLERHWPNVRRWRDITTFPPDTQGINGRYQSQDAADGSGRESGEESQSSCRHGISRGWKVDLICGGFPCQDISYAGRGAGLSGERSGLFYEAIRVIRELGPRYVVLENVAALLTRGLDQVLGTLASIGFDAEWHCIPAAAVGAPHIRDRVFVVADSMRVGSHDRPETIRHGRKDESRASVGASCIWAVEPDVGRVAHGIPRRVDRLRGLGNAVVPQVAEWIGRRIMETANE